MHHYLIPLTCGPLLIVRLPSKGKPGRRQVAPKWRAVLRALTPVLQSHGMKRKDLSSIDNLSHPDEWDPAADVFAYVECDVALRRHLVREIGARQANRLAV